MRIEELQSMSIGSGDEMPWDGIRRDISDEYSQPHNHPWRPLRNALDWVMEA
jgi:hypothetical protein